MDSLTNLYESPAADLSADAPGGDPVAMRQRTLHHEAAIVGLGKLFIAMGLCLLSLSIAWSHIPKPTHPWLMIGEWGFGTGYYGFVQISMGYLISTRLPMARSVVALAVAPFLLAVPLGTLFGAYALWLACGKTGSAILSERHLAIRQATSEIRLPGSLLGWLAVPVPFLWIPLVWL